VDVEQEVVKDRISADDDFDTLVSHQWREHLRGLHPEVAERKRWKSGYWWNWYNELILNADDVHDENESELILDKKSVSFDDDDYQRSLGGCPPPTDEPGAAKSRVWVCY
jgi:hypothetical protein